MENGLTVELCGSAPLAVKDSLQCEARHCANRTAGRSGFRTLDTTDDGMLPHPPDA